MHRSTSYARLAFIGCGVPLVALGLVIKSGWPFLLGGLILLLAATRTH
jgi:hypothetical protein